MKKTTTFILILLMIFNMIIPAYATTNNFGIKAQKQENYNGKFIISVMVENEWIDAGSLTFDKYLSEKTIDIKGYLNTKNVLIKIVQNGGGESHLDSVFLDGQSAIDVNDGDSKLLNKLSKTDLDLISVNDGVVLEFSPTDNKGILTVVGRIENEIISKEPLQFPIENNYKLKDEISNFYNYKLDSNLGKIIADGIMEEVENLAPFAYEYQVPDSGHPAGNTYFWVMNDEKNLYVAMDFTPDNTYDGDKDYAKVYVNTNEGIKEFKVSVPETTWGDVGFAYTDKVEYEHKVYEFVIPFDEIWVDGAAPKEELELAFVAYGTAALTKGYHNPALAYDSKNKVYLSVFQNIKQGRNPDSEYSIFSHIYGQIMGSDGALIGGEFLIKGDADDLNDDYLMTPSVAYDSKNNNFLVVWDQNSSAIKAKTVSIDSNFIVTQGEAFYVIPPPDFESYLRVEKPKLAFDSNKQEFLVIWMEANSLGNNISGQFITSDKGLNGSHFSISNGDSKVKVNPTICYSSEDESYLIAWTFWDSDQNNDVIEALIVESAGTVNINASIIIDKIYYNSMANIAINNLTSEFLITYAQDNKIHCLYIGLETLGETIKPKIVQDSERIFADNNGMSNFHPTSFFDGNGSMLCLWNRFYNDSLSGNVQMKYIDRGEILDTTNPEKTTYASYTDVQTMASTGDSLGKILVAYTLYKNTGIGYRLIGDDIQQSEDPTLSFDKENYNVTEGETIQSHVTLFNYDGFNDKDVTGDDNISYYVGNSDIAEIITSGAIKGISAGSTTISAIYSLPDELVLMVSAIVTVTKKQSPSDSGSNTPIKTPIGQIIVDNKVVKDIYPEDLVDKNGMYSFSTTKTGDNAKLWLYSSSYKNIAVKSPKGTLQLVWDAGSYNLPLYSDEVLKEANNISNSKVNIIIEKVKNDSLIEFATEAKDKLGGKLVSGLVDFNITVEGANKTANIKSYDLYVTRTINNLNKIDEYNTTAMKFINDKKELTFAPSVFDKNFTNIKYRSNGIFTILENPQSFYDIENHWAKTNIEKLATRNIVFGKNKNNFEPNDKITRAEFAVMITRALGITEEEGNESFNDVKNQWFGEDIKTAYKFGLISGKNDGNFYPDEKILRKDMAVIINNALRFVDKDIKIANADFVLSTFKDNLIIDNYAKDSIALCADFKIIIGRDTGNFDPNEYATRAEATAMVERMLRYLKFMN